MLDKETLTKYRIITISGPDRVGKATQSKLLSKALDAKLMSFPNYNTFTGQLIRGALTNSNLYLKRLLIDEEGNELENVVRQTQYKKDSYHFQCLQMMNRLEAQEEIIETLKTKHLVMDRYEVDALVYGEVDGCDIQWLNKFLTCIKASDLVILLTGKSFTRQEVADVNENSEFQYKINYGYKEFLSYKYGHIKEVETVEASSKEESIYATHILIVNEVNKFLSKNSFDKIKPLSFEEVRSNT